MQLAKICLFLILGIALFFWRLAVVFGLPIAMGVLLVGLLAVLLVFIKLFYPIWKTIKKIGEALAPDKTIISLSAGERFEGKVFSWTFPVECKIEQSVLCQYEILLVRPALDLWNGAPEVTFTAASMLIEDMKDMLEGELEEALPVVPDCQTHDYVPVQIGPYSGEGKFFETASKSGQVKVELICLGDENISIGWNLVTPVDKFQPLADQLRQLVSLIEYCQPAETESSEHD